MSIGKLYFKVKLFYLKEQLFVFKFYKNKNFLLTDLALFISYFFFNPFRISKSYLKKNHVKDIHQYGETPLTTLYKIAKICKIRPSDTVIDLGSGRGRGCFFLSHLIGCHTIGIEQVPFFVNLSNRIKKLFRFKNITFLKKNYLDLDFSKINVVYLYGSMLEDQTISKLLKKLQTLPKNAKVITISFSLKEYSSDYQLLKQFSTIFPWGITTGYLQIKR